MFRPAFAKPTFGRRAVSINASAGEARQAQHEDLILSLSKDEETHQFARVSF
jgi:hypothetical protein